MFNKKRIKKSLEESLLDYASGNISPKERRRIEEYLNNNPDKRHLLAKILKQIHLPPSQEEEEWIQSSIHLTAEEQAEKMVAYYLKANPEPRLKRIWNWRYFFEQKLPFGHGGGSKKYPMVFVSITVGIGLLALSWIGISLYRYVDNLKAKNNLIAEIRQDRVPRSFFLRPSGKNLEPDFFSAQLGQETTPFSDSTLSQIVRKNLDDADFLTVVGQYYLFHRNFEMAEEYYKKALRASKNNTSILNDLAIICHTRDDLWYAYQLLEKAHNQEPKRVEIVYNLALVARALGKTEATRFWQSEFKRLNTSPAWAELLKEKFDLME